VPPPKHFDPSTLRVTLVCNGVSMVTPSTNPDANPNPDPNPNPTPNPNPHPQVLLREEHGLYESVARSEAARQPLAYLSIELPW